VPEPLGRGNAFHRDAAVLAGGRGRIRGIRYTSPANASYRPKRAAGLNLDHVKFTHCLESGETAEKVRVDRALGKKLGVSSTPSFFVGTFDGNGTISLTKRINGAVPYERFEEVL
jgi:protein-disulfide isomerase